MMPKLKGGRIEYPSYLAVDRAGGGNSDADDLFGGNSAFLDNALDTVGDHGYLGHGAVGNITLTAENYLLVYVDEGNRIASAVNGHADGVIGIGAEVKGDGRSAEMGGRLDLLTDDSLL